MFAHMILWSYQFFRLPAIFLLLICWKNVSGAYTVSAHFGKQHINLVIPIIDFVSFYITGELTKARKRLFDLHLINTEDHLFPHNGLRANIFSTLDAGPSYSIQNPLIDSDCCDKQQPRGFLGPWIKISLNCFACRELDFGVGSTQKLHWINLLDSPSIPSWSQNQFNQILRKTSFLIHGSTCVGVMLDQELISLNVGLCSPNFAQRRGTGSWTQSTR